MSRVESDPVDWPQGRSAHNTLSWLAVAFSAATAVGCGIAVHDPPGPSDDPDPVASRPAPEEDVPAPTPSTPAVAPRTSPGLSLSCSEQPSVAVSGPGDGVDLSGWSTGCYPNNDLVMYGGAPATPFVCEPLVAELKPAEWSPLRLLSATAEFSETDLASDWDTSYWTYLFRTRAVVANATFDDGTGTTCTAGPLRFRVYANLAITGDEPLLWVESFEPSLDTGIEAIDTGNCGPSFDANTMHAIVGAQLMAQLSEAYVGQEWICPGPQ